MLEISNRINYNLGKAKAKSSLAGAYVELDNINQAERLLKESLVFLDENSLNKEEIYTLSGIYTSLSQIAEKKGENRASLSYSIKFMNIAKKMDETSFSTGLNNISNGYLVCGILDSAFFYIDSSISYSRAKNLRRIYGLSNGTKGEIYEKTGDINNAIKHVLICTRIMDSLNSNTIKLFYYNKLSELYYKNGEVNNAFIYLKKHMSLKDSLFGQESITKLNEMEKNLAVSEKQKEIELAEADLKKQTLITKFFIGGALFFILVAALMLIMFRKQRKTSRLLDQQKKELAIQKETVEKSKADIELLSEIGRKITSTLDIKLATRVIYEHVNKLMEASVLGVGLLNSRKNSLSFRGLFEKGEVLPDFYQSLSDERLGAICYNQNIEIVINDVNSEAKKYLKVIKPAVQGEDTNSLIYLPLVSGDKRLGVLTVQSFNKNAYNDYHLFILRNLAVYIAIAIENYNAYHQTDKAYAELKNAQTQLVQSEKMASLGQLTAGVAHEINNPINYISGGIDSLKTCFNELNELLAIYTETEKAQDTEEKSKLLSKAIRLKKELDYDALQQEIKDLLSSIKTGANRTTEIVKSLRTFSRLDESSLKKANLEEGIDSTLVILRSQLKDRIEVIKEYGQVGELNCYAGQLNQVFMNIINNAAQAIESTGTIYIKTDQDEKYAYTHIKDSGKGMSVEVQKRIFEPFFTTKDVGQGTGLGLSIVLGIVEKHNGTIEVVSEEGKGTTFIIKISKHLA